jgi:hypothetical protein
MKTKPVEKVFSGESANNNDETKKDPKEYCDCVCSCPTTKAFGTNHGSPYAKVSGK